MTLDALILFSHVADTFFLFCGIGPGMAGGQLSAPESRKQASRFVDSSGQGCSQVLWSGARRRPVFRWIPGLKNGRESGLDLGLLHNFIGHWCDRSCFDWAPRPRHLESLQGEYQQNFHGFSEPFAPPSTARFRASAGFARFRSRPSYGEQAKYKA